ncbi:hypothetical protein [Streptomyces sp. NPDC026659]|uniref:hypothetical protein n=1 Tax=Streptomyces sp. NPDC026659 TaxID=3155123 RepID=UPI0033D958E6
MGTEEQPEVHDIRFGDDGRIEEYDGADWQPYGREPDEGEEPLFRDGEGSSGGTDEQRDGTGR